MSKIILTFILVAIMSFSINAQEKNPLLEPFDTPFGVPPFLKIKTEHFMPALKKAMELHKTEISNIVNSKAEPNFKNTIEEMDFSGYLLGTISQIFQNLSGANTNAELQKTAKEVLPMLTKHYDDISLNPQLFEKVKKVYETRATAQLNPEQTRLVEKIYRQFIRNGAGLDEKKKTRLREINEKLSLLELKFGDNVLKETNNFKLVIENKSDLEGLPQNLIDVSAEDAKAKGLAGKWLFTLQNPSVMPFLQYSAKRELREKLQQAYIKRGDNDNEFDNKAVIKDIANLRLEKANLLGYATHADNVLEETMAKKPDNVLKLLNQIWEPALKRAKEETIDLQKMIDKEGNTFKLQPWDWRYYAEKVRKEKYDLDEEQLKPYFELKNVKDGIFTLVQMLYGLTFKERTDVPVYHPDAKAYEVLKADGSHLGVLYMDFHPRDSKRGGAWMTNYRNEFIQNGVMTHPVISVVCNFSKPTAETPSLLTLDEAETFFHAFGHALHGLLANTTYPTLSGTSISRDFVELPSQIMEHWVTEPEMMKFYAKHYKTGEVIPKELVEKIDKSSKFNQGFVTVEFLAASFLDMYYHSIKQELTEPVNNFETNQLTKLGLIPEIVSRYRSTYFRHVFSGGYDAGYYSYIWAGVLDADAFEAFKEKGIFDKKTADAFRMNVLEKGNTVDPMLLYVNFRGSEPKIDALLKNRGLK